MKRIILVLAIALLFLTACSSNKKTLEENIVGTWKNNEGGYFIEFRSGGMGFIPGVAGAIPDSNFLYTVIDEFHIQFDLQGQTITIEITINGDQLTWKDDLGVVSYTRVK